MERSKTPSSAGVLRKEVPSIEARRKGLSGYSPELSRGPNGPQPTLPDGSHCSSGTTTTALDDLLIGVEWPGALSPRDATRAACPSWCLPPGSAATMATVALARRATEAHVPSRCRRSNIGLKQLRQHPHGMPAFHSATMKFMVFSCIACSFFLLRYT